MRQLTKKQIVMVNGGLSFKEVASNALWATNHACTGIFGAFLGAIIADITFGEAVASLDSNLATKLLTFSGAWLGWTAMSFLQQGYENLYASNPYNK